MLPPILRFDRRLGAELISLFVNGRISNFEYERRFPECSPDPVLFAVFLRLWGSYDDLHEHKLDGVRALTSQERERVGRWVLFLELDLPYRWPTGTLWDWLRRLSRGREEPAPPTDESVWPFATREEFESALAARGGVLPLTR